MDIAALSIISNQAQVKQQASLSVMKMVMNSSAEQTQALISMASEMNSATELSVNPHLGSKLDVSV